jgi:hypothetical protein
MAIALPGTPRLSAGQECLDQKDKNWKTGRIVGTIVRQGDLNVRSDKFDGMEVLLQICQFLVFCLGFWVSVLGLWF